MAYRVGSDGAKRANIGAKAGTRIGTKIAASRVRGDRALTRNVVLSGVALSCLSLIAAGVALRGSDRDFGAVPQAAGPKAPHIALVDPAPPQVAWRDPRVPIETPQTNAAVKTARLVPRAAPPPDENEAGQHAARPAPVPLPLARPVQVAAIAPPHQRADDMPTGSIGKPERDLTVALAKPAPAPLLPAAPARPARALTAHEKLYGGPVRIASLAPDSVRTTGFDPATGLPRAPYDRQTAVYVITDRKVYLPDGAALEAHSGLGDKMDDPRFVSVRMRGATPPHVYDLKLRESLFHGVEAVRMTPVGGEAAIFGRDGILAHTYMLGPNGQSNGCVSFRNYEAFLREFKSGRITRMAVIARLD